MPRAPASSLSRSSSPAAAHNGTGTAPSSSSHPHHWKPYAPPPRRSSSYTAYDEEPALSSLGAIYLSWGPGKKDPFPLCCPVKTKKGLVERYGEAAVGWMTAPAPIPLPQPQAALQVAAQHPQPQPLKQQQEQRKLPTLAGLALPPLPPLPPLPQLPSLPSLPPLPSSSHCSASLSPPALTYSPSSSPASSLSSHPSCALLASHQPDDSLFPTPAQFEEAFSSSSSFTLISQSLSLTPYAPLPLETVKPGAEEEDFHSSGASEAGLWSGGEEGGLMYNATDAESEASWAAW
ncbi:hypothetical protein JCM8547_007515 [Rhodosporidiobolus lusitaniae]